MELLEVQTKDPDHRDLTPEQRAWRLINRQRIFEAAQLVASQLQTSDATTPLKNELLIHLLTLLISLPQDLEEAGDGRVASGSVIGLELAVRFRDQVDALRPLREEAKRRGFYCLAGVLH